VRIMDKKDAVSPVEMEPKVFTVQGEAITSIARVADGKVVVGAQLECIDKLVKETRNRVVVAIAVTIATAITLSLGQLVGPVDVIAAIILIAVLVTVILRLQWRPKAPDAPL